MAAVLSHHHSSTSSPPPTSSPNANLTSLPPLITSPPSKASLQRVPSYANKRLSTFSNASNTHSSRSRPQSTVFPLFHSSLPYTLVRDFAYGPLHPLFYGPLPEQASEISTPASEVNRRLSDPPPVWDGARGSWSAGGWEHGEQLPQTSYADGPPWSEDEDIHSPVVTSVRHKKHKSNVVDFDQTRGRRGFDDGRRASYTGTNGDGNHIYYVSEVNESANGPGGEYITYPPNNQNLSIPSLSVPASDSRRDSHFATTLPRRSYTDEEAPGYASDEEMSDSSSPEDFSQNESRYSRDYQFTIASPDEEMHGKAVALFDFARENDNELPLIEGQVILVSYRHGQGWLVAQDPKTGESGLVPEEYVRLLRDIEGGWSGLMNGSGLASNEGLMSPISAGPEARTPTQADHGGQSNERYTPVVSTFSTSSKDLHPYPQHLLGTPTNADGQPLGRRASASEDPKVARKFELGGSMEGVRESPEPLEQGKPDGLR